MKAIYKSLLALTMVAPTVLTGCLDDPEITNGATQEQLSGSSTALDALCGGIASYMKTHHVWSTSASDFGYPAQMIIRDLLCQDMIQVYNNYQHFYAYESISIALNDGYLINQVIWYYYNLQVNACNGVIEAVDPATANDTQLNMLAQALAYRAMIYLDMARLYEYLPNETISPVNDEGNDISGLTVPINDPRRSFDPNNNPRVTHDEMLAFLTADLDDAESYFLRNNSRIDKTRPDLSVVYGLKARMYMWDENYPKAAEYARKAISLGVNTPLTREEWLSTTNGFNNMEMSSWMFAIQQYKEDECVQSYSCWTSFMASEGSIGYGSRYKNPMIVDANFYASISDRDWRKLSWVAPAGSPLSGQEQYVDQQFANGATQAYASLKFRPGQGELSDNNVAWATAIPLMRIEEMYLIEAEATAHYAANTGKDLLEAFMQTYRYSSYTCPATDQEGIIDECLKQKRIELWGEGQIMFDFKRLNKSVIRSYNGTNWPSDCRYNTNGRPGWMTLPMCGLESQLNAGTRGLNNPNPGGKFTPV